MTTFDYKGTILRKDDGCVCGNIACCRFITREEGVLHLHPHDFLVSLDQLIAGFHHELEADFRL